MAQVGGVSMPDALRREKIIDVFGRACEIAMKNAAGDLVLISWPVQEGVAINCRAESPGTVKLRFHVQSHDKIVTVSGVGEELGIGGLDDDGVYGQIADAIVNSLPEWSS
jgi:hypothetical protein